MSAIVTLVAPPAGDDTPAPHPRRSSRPSLSALRRLRVLVQCVDGLRPHGVAEFVQRLLLDVVTDVQLVGA